MNKHTRETVCPHCHKPLIDGDDILKCDSCAKLFPIFFGVPCFDAETCKQKTDLTEVYTRGEVRNNSEKAHPSSISSKQEDDYEERSAGNYVFPLAGLIPQKRRLLVADYTCLILTFELAKEFREVYTFNLNLETSKSILKRCSDKEIKNVTAVQGDVCSLPFPDEFFDGIVVDNSVGMVNMPLSSQQSKKQHEQILKELNRVLQLNGVLCMNSVDAFKPSKEKQRGFWLFSPSDNPFALFFRTICNVKRFKKGLLSRDTWSEIFRHAGFTHLKWFSAYPGSLWYRYVVSLGNAGAFMFVLKTLLSGRTDMLGRLSKVACRLISLFPIIVRGILVFSPPFVLFAARNGKLRLGLGSGNDVVSVWDSEDEELAVTVNDRRVNLYLVERKSGGFKKKYTLPINQRAEDKIRMAHVSVDLIRKTCPSLGRSLPNSILHSREKGIFEYTSAVMGSPIDVTDSESLKSFFGFLLKLDELSLEQSDIERIPAEFDIRHSLSRIAVENGLEEEILPVLKKAQLVHGDLNHGNILVDRTHKTMAGLIDFEHAKIGPNVLNWYDFLLRNFVLYGRTLPIDPGVVLKRCRRLPGHIQAVPILNRLTRDFLRLCKTTAFLHSQFVILYMVYLCQDPIVRDLESVVEGIKAMNLTV